MPGRLTLDNDSLMVEAAVEGLGLAFVSDFWVTDHLAAGTLRAVLEDWTPPFPGLRLYYPGHRHMTAGLRAFVDMLREERKSAAKGKAAGRLAAKRRKIIANELERLRNAPDTHLVAFGKLHAERAGADAGAGAGATFFLAGILVVAGCFSAAACVGRYFAMIAGSIWAIAVSGSRCQTSSFPNSAMPHSRAWSVSAHRR